jgi:hypothetical protein
MKRINIVIFISLSVFLLSCSDKNGPGVISVKRIQYDVPVISEDLGQQWWVNNLEGSVREELLRTMFEKAMSGDIPVYDYFHTLIKPDEVALIGRDTIYQSLKRTYPPYDDYDTMVVTSLSYRDVSKIRFLEEWEINRNNLRVEKKVVGMAPVHVREYGDESYNQVLFWFYFDDNYPGILRDK